MGAVEQWGEPIAAERLREALVVPPLPERVEDEERPLVEGALHVHLFHSFAARMHPLSARSLLRDVEPGQTVLDPFVGSGTVLVEAALRGARGAGMDIGELQLRLSRFKATPLPEGMRRALLQRAQQVALASEERVRGRRRPERSWPAKGFDDPRRYDPHIYLELCGLRLEIAAVQASDPPLAQALLLIFSSIVIKASRQRGESSQQERPRPLGKLQVTRWFLRRAEEVVRLHAAYAERLGSPTTELALARGDARRDLARLVRPRSVSLVLTSPPYLGVYDYAAHHESRCAWLELPLAETLRGELGARRHAEATPLEQLLPQHQRDCEDWLSSVAQALAPGGRALVLVGDSMVQGVRVPGDEPVLAGAAAAGLRALASCAVARPSAPRGPGADFRGAPLREHLLLLAR